MDGSYLNVSNSVLDCAGKGMHRDGFRTFCRLNCRLRRSRNADGLFGDFLDIDYAKVAEAYGCKSYSIRTMDQLTGALKDAKTVKNRPVLFDIKVLPKTMTDGYSSWWRVGDTEVSECPKNVACWKDLQEHLKDARKY